MYASLKADEKADEDTVYKYWFSFLLINGTSGVFQLWNVVFIYSLLIKQSLHREKGQVDDEILGHEVDIVVSIQNRKLFTKGVQQVIELDEEKRKLINLRA